MSQSFTTEPEVYTLQSDRPGTHVVIIVGIHGNERVGLNILPWLRNLPIERGTITILVANPDAVAANKRYIQVNLNRRFGLNLAAYPEDTLARNIETHLDKADALLDIHSYNEAMDRPFIIANQYAEAMAGFLPPAYIMTGWQAYSTGASDDYMGDRGKPAICLECGSSDRPEAYEDLAKQCVTAFLQATEHISGQAQTYDHTYVSITRCELRQLDDFSFDQDYRSFDQLEPHKPFAQQAQQPYIAGENECIIFPRPHAKIGEEVFLLGSIRS